MILRALGYAVLEAENDGEAARVCIEHAGAIRLLVIRTQSELAGRLNVLRPEMRILILSSLSNSGTPASTDSLVQKIRELLHGAPVFTAASSAPG